MNKKIGPIIVVIVILLVLVRSAFYIVDQTEQALLVQLGKPVPGTIGPGLHFKIPFIQEAIKFESRLMDYDAAPAEILTADKKNLKVDNYAKWKIVDPLKFYLTVRNPEAALLRIDDIIYAELRVELGRHNMIDIISKLRADIMAAVTVRSDQAARDYGISVADVRIKRADLPQENERAVYGRMRAERQRQAKKYRSEGQEEALKIRSAAERERTIILAEAYRKAQELRGQGDAEATKIYAEAYNQDAEFFNFLRSLDAYRKSLKSGTTLVLDPNDEFLKTLKESGARLQPPAEERPIVYPEFRETTVYPTEKGNLDDRNLLDDIDTQGTDAAPAPDAPAGDETSQLDTTAPADTPAAEADTALPPVDSVPADQ